MTPGDLYMKTAAASQNPIWEMSPDVRDEIRLMDGDLIHWPHSDHLWCLGIPVKMVAGSGILELRSC